MTTLPTSSPSVASRPPVPRLALSRRELAEALGVSDDTIDLWTHREGLPCLRMNKRVVRYPLDQVKQWLAERAGVGT